MSLKMKKTSKVRVGTSPYATRSTKNSLKTFESLNTNGGLPVNGNPKVVLKREIQKLSKASPEKKNEVKNEHVLEEPEIKSRALDESQSNEETEKTEVKTDKESQIDFIPLSEVPKFEAQTPKTEISLPMECTGDTSATTKALQQLETSSQSRKFYRKKSKIPSALRRRRLNLMLNKILSPKSAVIFLHELKPGCTYKFQDQDPSNPQNFVVHVEHNNKILAAGQGTTKPSAKNAAAENAIRVLVGEVFAQRNSIRNRQEFTGEGIKDDTSEMLGSTELMETEDLPWAGLASFAMYKMFSEWQNQGTEFQVIPPPTVKKFSTFKSPPIKKELPSNAEQLHPSLLLNMMRPGNISFELERTMKENVSLVTMGYEIDGEIYKGTGTNKKEARKEAAKVALSALYGLKYSNPNIS